MNIIFFCFDLITDGSFTQDVILKILKKFYNWCKAFKMWSNIRQKLFNYYISYQWNWIYRWNSTEIVGQSHSKTRNCGQYTKALLAKFLFTRLKKLVMLQTHHEPLTSWLIHPGHAPDTWASHQLIDISWSCSRHTMNLSPVDWHILQTHEPLTSWLIYPTVQVWCEYGV